MHAHHAVKRRLRALGPHGGDDVKIHAAREILLARGDDDALRRRIGQGLIDLGRQVHERLGRHDVHRLVLDIPGQGNDAIGVHGIGEIGHL